MLERLLDSVILIDHLNAIPAATDFLIGLDPKKTTISVISRAEILARAEKENIGEVKSLLDQYALLTIDREIADEAAKLRRSERWKLPDAFQAALALHHNVKLTTRNTKDFDPKKYAFVEVPYKMG